LTALPRYIRDDLADLVLGIDYGNLPPDVVHQAKRLVLDTMGCAMGGFNGPPTEIVRDVVRDMECRGESSVIGEGGRTSCAFATLVNGTMLRYLDHNDYYFRRDTAHASANIAAALAVAEREGLSGRDAILGIVVGYEVQLRLCTHAGSLWERGWAGATNLSFSAAAVASRLMGLDAAQTANALAIAGSVNNTLTESRHGNIPMMKATGEANAAKGGVEAALFARRGLTGPEQIFEGRWGWIPVVAGDADPAALVGPLDGHYLIMDDCLKPYAAEMMTQSSVAAAIDAVARHDLDAAEIAHVEARYHEYALRKPSWDAAKLAPKDRETADHSFPYCIAVAMLDGDCGPAQFTPEKLADPAVRELMARIELTTDPELTAAFPESFGTAIKVTMRSGEIFESICRTPPGHPRNPLSDAQIEDKFRRLSAGLLDAGAANRAIAAIWDLDRCEDIGAFMACFNV
jgi:2-methylcitrate dehydratase